MLPPKPCLSLRPLSPSDLIFVLFISTHLVSTRPAPICRSKTLFSILEFNMVF